MDSYEMPGAGPIRRGELTLVHHLDDDVGRLDPVSSLTWPPPLPSVSSKPASGEPCR
jgi:hypothetical protein